MGGLGAVGVEKKTKDLKKPQRLAGTAYEQATASVNHLGTVARRLAK